MASETAHVTADPITCRRCIRELAGKTEYGLLIVGKGGYCTMGKVLLEGRTILNRRSGL